MSNKAFGLNLEIPEAPFSLAMPRRGSGQAKVERSTCETENINRAWMNSDAVRFVTIRNDRMFESHRGRGADKVVKVSIKDAVHNKFALIPLLESMASHDGHPLPYVKDLARETLAKDLYILQNKTWGVVGSNMMFLVFFEGI